MHIFLYGPSGSGKTTVGKALAEHLRLPFVDSDQIIETNAGMTIPQIVEAHGMTKVRDLETAVLEQIVNGKESVIALGGGALLREENRALVETSGKVILLKAELPTLIERLQNDPHKRPLLAGDLKSKLTEYLESRRDHYDSFQRTIRVDDKTPEQISREIQTVVGRHRLSAMGEYDVQVGQIGNLPYGDLIVTDENVAKHRLKNLGVEKSIVLPAGEEHKNLETVSRLWKAFLENGLDRKSVVIALGGGVICDLAGFAASTYMRGVNWIAVPTTLLAMVDASLGGKTGFDLPEGKNLIGSFHPPRLVLADPSLLLTLNDRDLRSGMAEVVKHGIIADPELFALCANGFEWVKNNLEEIVKRAMAVKIRIIEEDPYEKGIRATLNLGHTVGHAVELVSGFKLSHGEAVSIGMVVEARYAERIGAAKKGLTDEIEKTLSELGLPVKIPKALPRDEIVRAMRVDKKRSAKSIRFALPVAIGKVELVDVDELDDVL
ncbi:MAG: 3-dehydroquinate synthase [Anaerolineales bacterium]|nr:3-dehydroquinate synthase [Anaerolineales bacterium]